MNRKHKRSGSRVSLLKSVLTVAHKRHSNQKTMSIKHSEPDINDIQYLYGQVVSVHEDTDHHVFDRLMQELRRYYGFVPISGLTITVPDCLVSSQRQAICRQLTQLPSTDQTLQEVINEFVELYGATAPLDVAQPEPQPVSDVSGPPTQFSSDRESPVTSTESSPEPSVERCDSITSAPGVEQFVLPSDEASSSPSSMGSSCGQ